MELSELGEFGLITLLKKDTIFDEGSVILGIGDDAAAVLANEKKLQLFTTDMLVEGKHFDLRTIAPWQLGYKSIAVNLSDIAAMGGKPKHVLISIALPKYVSVEKVVDCYQGMKSICKEYGVNIIGGDTVASDKSMIINVTAIGEIEPMYLAKRSGAKVGDLIAITGTLGNSSAGLELLQENVWEFYDFAMPLVKAHVTPKPQVKAGQIIAAFGASSMCDISDGLASELHHISTLSEVGMCIYHTKIPWSKELKQASDILKKPLLDYVMYGGEDYQLLFTISPEKFQRLQRLDFGISITAIGDVVAKQEGLSLVSWDGQSTEIKNQGFNHFS